MPKSFKFPSSLSYIASGLVGAAAAHTLRGRSSAQPIVLSEKPLVPCVPDIRPILQTIEKEGQKNSDSEQEHLVIDLDNVVRYLSRVAYYRTAFGIYNNLEKPVFDRDWDEIMGRVNELKSKYTSANFSVLENFMKDAHEEDKKLNPPVKVAMRSPKRKSKKTTRRKIVKSPVKRSRAVKKRSARKSSKPRARAVSRRR
jgi:hypothetical protein